METNLSGAWRVTEALVPLLRESAKRGWSTSRAAQGPTATRHSGSPDGTGILVNAVCPGLTATWPGAEEMGARPVAEGAVSVVFAATLPDGGPSAGFFRDGRPLAGRR